MAVGKLFIGRKVRELRLAHNATQSQFAERVGISTSYLNQIESNHRPVSASVLLALADKFQLNISELSSGETDRLVSALLEALSDPIFDAYAPSFQELKLITHNAPGFAHALIACHQAYRRNSEQLASMDDRLDVTAAVELTPYEEVRDFFHFVDNYVHDLDTLAEKLAQELGDWKDDSYTTLTNFLDKRFGVRVVHGQDKNALRHYDPASRILSVNPYAAAHTRVFQVAVQAAQLYAGDVVETIVRDAGFRTEEAAEICRIGLHNYFAGALLMPYRTFLRTARELRHDLELLAARFGASLEQVCHRLSTLQRPGLKGVPIFLRVSTGRATLPNGTVRRSCSLPVLARPVRCGMPIRLLKRPGGSSASWRKPPTACAISVSRRRPARALAGSAPSNQAMRSPSAARFPTRMHSFTPMT